MTLSDLRTRLDAYANRRDPDYLLNRDEFLRTGHRWVERKFHAREAFYAKWQTEQPVSHAVGTVPLPACYRASAELRVYRLPERTPLERITSAALREPFVNAAHAPVDLRDTTALGLPAYFAVLGHSLQIRPLPATALDLEIVGTGWADPMVNDRDETVLTQEAPDAILYAALRELWLFLGDDPQKTYWEQQATQALTEWAGDRVHEEHPPPLVMELPG
jgi:hypothetical protein